MAAIYTSAIFRRNQIFGDDAQENPGSMKTYGVHRTVAGYSLMVVVERATVGVLLGPRRVLQQVCDARHSSAGVHGCK